MSTPQLILAISISLAFISLLIWLTLSMMKQSKRDWQTYEDLNQKSTQLKTPEEIKAFYEEFTKKAMKIDNPIIIPKLQQIDGYIHGLYKGLTNEK